MRAVSFPSLLIGFRKTQNSQIVPAYRIPCFSGGQKRTVEASERVAKINWPKYIRKILGRFAPFLDIGPSRYLIGIRFFLRGNRPSLGVCAHCFFCRFRIFPRAYIFSSRGAPSDGRANEKHKEIRMGMHLYFFCVFQILA